MADATEWEAKLSAAWAEFCERLKAAGELAFRNEAAGNPVDRAAGVRQLSRNIALALSFELENSDPRHPELQHYFDPIRKQGGDNPDGYYLGAPIDGTHNYRLSGKLGNASYVAITVVERGRTPFGGRAVSTLMKENIVCAADGAFEIFIGPLAQAQASNFLRTTPETFRLTCRQFFADWSSEQSMTARIDCLTNDTAVPLLTPQSVIDGLTNAGKWLHFSLAYWVEMLLRWKRQPNRFLTYGELDGNRIDATPGGEPVICWVLGQDEALIVRVHPPEAQYWSVECGNCWWESMDYRYRLCSTNRHHAVLEEDGELILVLSPDDTGVPNWLDSSGHSEGYITFRWIGAPTVPQPTAMQVKRSEVTRYLPPGVKKISAVERQTQLEERRRSIMHRFNF